MKPRRHWMLVLLLLVTACGFVDRFADPRGDRALVVLDVTPAGDYLGAINGHGEIRVWDLRSRAVVQLSELSGTKRPASPIALHHGFGFRGDAGELLLECDPQKVCAVSLTSGDTEVLFDHGDPQDSIHLVASSVDGTRLAFGTLAGRVLTFDSRSREVVVRKKRDEWSPGGPAPIFVLEGTANLDLFLSSSLYSSGSRETVAERQASIHRQEGYLQFEKRREALWADPVIWAFEGEDPVSEILGIPWRVSADISPRENRLAICDEGGPRVVMNHPRLDGRFDLRSLAHRGASACGGIRFLDSSGDWIGIIADGAAEMELCHVDAAGSWSCRDRFRLRRKPGSGARPLIALPEKRWFFVGLAQGGVDWYELDTEGKGRARFLRHLSWND